MNCLLLINNLKWRGIKCGLQYKFVLFFFYHFCILQPQLNKHDGCTLIFSVGNTYSMQIWWHWRKQWALFLWCRSVDIFPHVCVLPMTKGFRDNEKLCFFLSFICHGLRAHAYITKLIVTKTYALAHCLSPQGRRASAAPSLVQCRTPFVSRAVTGVTIGHVWVQRRIRWKMQIPVCLLDPASALAHLLLHLWHRHLGLGDGKQGLLWT